MKTLPTASVNAIITDPPFHISVGRADGWDEKRGFGADPWPTDISSLSGCVNWTMPHAEQAARILKPGGAIVVMGGNQSLVGWDIAAAKCGFQWMAEIVVLWNSGKPRNRNFGSLHTRVVWYCRTGLRHTFNTPAISIYSNVLVAKKVPTERRHHPSEKPVGITNFLVTLLSNPGDLILDPFCGSGSTLVSADQAGRTWLGVDEEEKYCQISTDRAMHSDDEFPDPVYLWVNGKLTPV